MQVESKLPGPCSPRIFTPARLHGLLLAGYWLLHIVGLWVFTLISLHTEWFSPEQGSAAYYVQAGAGFFLLGWLMMIPIWPAMCLAISTWVWWRRPALALSPLLLFGVYCFFATEDSNDRKAAEYIGDGLMIIWLPFVSAAVVICLVALVGRWQTHHVDVTEEVQRAQAQFGLRDVFIAIVFVAGCIPMVQAMVVSAQRESTLFLDGLTKAIAGFAAMFIVPQASLIAVGTMRLMLTPRTISKGQIAVPLLGWLGYVALAIFWMVSVDASQQQWLEGLATLCVFPAGIAADAALGGYLLRRCGYRVQSHSWRKKPPLPSKPLKENIYTSG